MVTAVLTSQYPLLHAAACHIHGPAKSFLVERCTDFHLATVEANHMPQVPGLEGSDTQQMSNLRMNMGYFVKHSMTPIN